MSDDHDAISSPPWPSDQTSVDDLYAHLKEFWAWIEQQLPPVNRFLHTEEKKIPQPRTIGSLERHRGLGLVRFFHIHLVLRAIREQWDDVIRRFESNWTSPRAYERRADVLRAAVIQANRCYLSDEMLEAEMMKHMPKPKIILMTEQELSPPPEKDADEDDPFDSPSGG